MLQLSVPVLANAYAYIFSHILRNGIYPSMWRENMIKSTVKEVVLWIPIIIEV